MTPNRFDQLTRRASLATLATLGAVGVAGLLPQAAVEAKQSASKKAKKKCKKQVGQCLSFLQAACPGQLDPAECLADAERCCPVVASCDFTAFFACTIQQPVP